MFLNMIHIVVQQHGFSCYLCPQFSYVCFTMTKQVPLEFGRISLSQPVGDLITDMAIKSDSVAIIRTTGIQFTLMIKETISKLCSGNLYSLPCDISWNLWHGKQKKNIVLILSYSPPKKKNDWLEAENAGFVSSRISCWYRMMISSSSPLKTLYLENIPQ